MPITLINPFFAVPFPQVVTSSTSTSINTQSHSVTLPSGIAANDGLIILFQHDGTTIEEDATLSGWTRADYVSVSTSALAIFTKLAVGSESGSVTVTTTTGERAAHVALRIDSWFENISTGIEISSGATDTSTAPNPDSLTPAWGALKTLWIAVYGQNNGGTTSGYPTNFADNQLNASTGDGSGEVQVACASKEELTATQDPGAFTSSKSAAWRALTIAIRPKG